MEQLHTARRSASHGSLNRRYAANTGVPPRMVPPHPFFRPLRSVNENTSLLASPGPLESMLKTTTETGDISVFSIKPTRSPATIHAPLRARPGFGDINWQRPSRSNRIDTPGCRDDGRRLPSYRDTASEIISMYGSGSQRSASSSLSHPFDDMGQRSYSMTSCSSRPLPNKKSNGTLQSQPSGTFLQRPRSPFPYPTRLKRPGVRPASPAWTENGGVDYSRMIQIDRFSHRTVHGLYKPTYPHYGRRATPGLSRFDANRSVPSLSSYNTLPGPGPGPGPQYSGGQASSAPTTWGTRFRSRLDSGASDNSLGSSSLTSIVDMYRPSPCAPPGQDHYFRTQSGGAFYYDYSEDFDPYPERVAPYLAPMAPLAPIPTRAASLHRPMVLDETCSLRFRDPNDQNMTTMLHATIPMGTSSTQMVLGQGEDILHPIESFSDIPSRCDPETPKNPSVHRNSEGYRPHPSEDKIQPSDDNTPRNSGFPAHLADDVEHVQKVPNHYMTCSDLQQPMPMSHTSKNDEENCEKQNVQILLDSPRPEDYDSYQEDMQTPSVSHVRSSSQPPSMHRPVSLSCAKKESVSSTVSGYIRRSKFYSLEPGLSDLASLVQCLDKAAQSSVLFDTSSDTVIVNHADGDEEMPQDTFLPEPHESQYVEIEVTAPVGSGPHAREDFRGDSDDYRGHKRQCAVSNFDANPSPVAGETRPPPITGHLTPIFAPQPISPARRLRLQNSVPQLMKALPPLPSLRKSESCVGDSSFDGLDLSMCFSPVREEDTSLGLDESLQDRKNYRPSNGKLRLKVSRRPLPKMHETPGSTGLNMTTDLSRIRLQGSSEHFPDEEETTHRSESTETGSVQPKNCGEQTASVRSPTPTGSVVRAASSETRQPLPSDSDSPQRTLNSVSLASMSDMRSSFSDGSAGSHKPARGLRKRVSDLRIRLAESRLRSGESRDLTGTAPDRTGTVSGPSHSSTTRGVPGNSEQHQHHSAGELGSTLPGQSKGFRGRMSKWMKTVRQAVMVACTGTRQRG